MKYQTVLFDLDGTLIDSRPGIIECFKKALADLNIAIPSEEVLNTFVGPPLFSSFNGALKLSADKAEEAIRIYRKYYAGESGVYNSKIYAGIKELLKKLKNEGFRLGVASSKADYLCDIILKHHGIFHYFDAVCGSPADRPGAVKADSIRCALKKIPGTAVRTTVLIGDRKYDANGAKETGIDSIGVLYGYGSPEEMEKSSFSYIADFDDIYPILTGENISGRSVVSGY